MCNPPRRRTISVCRSLGVITATVTRKGAPCTTGNESRVCRLTRRISSARSHPKPSPFLNATPCSTQNSKRVAFSPPGRSRDASHRQTFPPRTDTKVSAIPSSDRSRVAHLVVWAPGDLPEAAQANHPMRRNPNRMPGHTVHRNPSAPPPKPTRSGVMPGGNQCHRSCPHLPVRAAAFWAMRP
jgi:hypothetical protein